MLTAISFIVLLFVLVIIGGANPINDAQYLLAALLLPTVAANVVSFFIPGIFGLLTYLAVFVTAAALIAGFLFDYSGEEKSKFLKWLITSEVVALGSTILAFALLA